MSGMKAATKHNGALRVSSLIPSRENFLRTPPSSEYMQPCRELGAIFGVSIPTEEQRQATKKAVRREQYTLTLRGQRKSK